MGPSAAPFPSGRFFVRPRDRQARSGRRDSNEHRVVSHSLKCGRSACQSGLAYGSPWYAQHLQT